MPPRWMTQPRLGALLGFLVGLFLTWSPVFSLLGGFGGYLLSGGWRFLLVAVRTFPRDAKALSMLLRVKLQLLRLEGRGVADVFLHTVSRFPARPCFLYEDQAWSFQQVDDYSNRVANLLLETGHKPGDVVAIFAESRPQFVCLWLGMAKIGVVGALINFNLRTQSLIHCVEAADARSFIFGAELSAAVLEVSAGLAPYKLFCLGGGDGGVSAATDLDQHLQRASGMSPPRLHKPRLRDRLFYIYTSGTTGLPKAAIITHARFYYMAKSIGYVNGITTKDVLYDVLPLYHTAGGILGIGQALLNGTTVVIKRKFSASGFWADCVKYKCTVAQYIGELCRYLLAQPAKPVDRAHSVRCMFGNGLRPQIWAQFQKRFNVAFIGEFYGATESNANLVNTDNTVGAVGFLTMIAPSLYPVRLIRIDEDSGEPMRGPDSLCVACGPGQVGELVGGIVKGDLLREVDGYVNKSETEKKILRNVFKRGDAFFLTGDVLEMDALGYVYFKDRTGDTFRWKGENVSTSEVEASISNVLQLRDCAVYGVEVPFTEGRAGMAAIADCAGQAVSVDLLASSLPRLLPAYARPVFLRLVRQIDSTGTFKMKKTQLRKEGFDPASCAGDPLFYLESRTGHYNPLTEEVHQNILRGQLKL